jgi:hypothetical protein
MWNVPKSHMSSIENIVGIEKQIHMWKPVTGFHVQKARESVKSTVPLAGV